jgi:preprotein translocase subunit YajC
MNVMSILAMAGPAGAEQQQSPLMMPMMLVLMLAMFYFLIIRPQQRREKERRAMLDAVKSGDRVVFGGGFMGIVTNVKDKTAIVRIADNVKVEVVRGAISQVLGKDDTPVEEPAK